MYATLMMKRCGSYTSSSPYITHRRIASCSFVNVTRATPLLTMYGPLEPADTSHAPIEGTNRIFVIASSVDAVSVSSFSTPAIAYVATPADATLV